MTDKEKGAEDLIQCTVCGDYFRASEAYSCPRCRRTGMCRKHRVPGTRECASCVYEKKSRELHQMRQQLSSLRSFLRLTQFVLIVFIILFIALRTGLPEIVEFLQFGIITENLPYIGGAALIAYMVFFLILQSQKQQVKALEEQLVREDFRKGKQ